MPQTEIPDVTQLGNAPQNMLSLAVTLLIITWIALSLRILARGFLLRSFGWDDWTMIFTVIAFTIQCSFLIWMAEVEAASERENDLSAMSELVIDMIAFSGAYILTTVLLKISLALFFLRITMQPWQRYIIYAALTTYTIYGIAYFVLTVFTCGDPSKYLENEAKGKCISIKTVIIPASYTQTALNAFTDWLYALLPIYSLLTLHLPKTTKLWACVLLALGALGSIASLIRLRYVGDLLPTTDFFKNSVDATIWATIEPGLGITAASFATLRPMMQWLFDSARTLMGSQHSKSNGAAVVAPSSSKPLPPLPASPPTPPPKRKTSIPLRGLNRWSAGRTGFMRVEDENPEEGARVALVCAQQDEEKAYRPGDQNGYF